jgi:hypothetical protein
MGKGLFAGIDVSTQSCKLIVIDLGAEDIIFLDSVDRGIRIGSKDVDRCCSYGV